MTLHRRPLGRGRLVAAVSAILMLVGCLLPWFRAGGSDGIPPIEGNAFEGAGILVFLAALATLALVALPYAAGDRPVAYDRWWAYGALALVAAVALVARVAGIAAESRRARHDAARPGPRAVAHRGRCHRPHLRDRRDLRLPPGVARHRLVPVRARAGAGTRCRGISSGGPGAPSAASRGRRRRRRGGRWRHSGSRRRVPLRPDPRPPQLDREPRGVTSPAGPAPGCSTWKTYVPTGHAGFVERSTRRTFGEIVGGPYKRPAIGERATRDEGRRDLRGAPRAGRNRSPTGSARRAHGTRRDRSPPRGSRQRPDQGPVSGAQKPIRGTESA